jgi:transcriptional/translational regulatory protein YebC/TACO1
LEEHDPDKIFELAVEAGADDVTFEDDEVEIVGAVDAFKSISDILHEAGIVPEEAGLRMVPSNMMDLDTSASVQVLRVIEAMEELDDVQDIFHNLNISEEAVDALES